MRTERILPVDSVLVKIKCNNCNQSVKAPVVTFDGYVVSDPVLVETYWDNDIAFSSYHQYSPSRTNVYLCTLTPNKSKQEVEAEEAVEKAKSSLEAAKAVLESLKGIVN